MADPFRKVRTGEPLRIPATAYNAFIDAAHVESTDRFPFEADNNMLGAGVGIDLALTRRFNLRVDWGFALLDLENGDGSVDVDAGHNELSFVLTLIY